MASGIKMNVHKAHKVLGLETNREYTKAEIDSAFRKVVRLVHPDRTRQYDEYGIEQIEKLWKAVCVSRDILYKHYDYGDRLYDYGDRLDAPPQFCNLL